MDLCNSRNVMTSLYQGQILFPWRRVVPLCYGARSSIIGKRNHSGKSSQFVFCFQIQKSRGCYRLGRFCSFFRSFSPMSAFLACSFFSSLLLHVTLSSFLPTHSCAECTRVVRDLNMPCFPVGCLSFRSPWLFPRFIFDSYLDSFLFGSCI